MYSRFRFLLIILLFPAISNAQTDTWVDDSLSVYTEALDKALNEQRIDDVLAFHDIIYKAGAKSLHPRIYEYLYQSAADPRYEELHEVLGRIYQYAGNLEFYRADMNAAKKCFSQALENFKKADMQESAAGMAMNLGVILERSMAYDSAIISYNKAMPIFAALGDTSSVANCLENIGLAHHYKGNFDRALLFLEMADSVLQTNTPLTSERWTNNWYNKSTVLTAKGEYDQALSYAFKGLKLSEDLKDERRMNIGFVMLEDVYEELGDKENWLKYIRKAKVFAEKSNNGLRMSELNTSLGYHFLEVDNLDSAIYYSDISFTYYRENNFSEGLSRSYILQGSIQYKMKKYREAIVAYEKALVNLSASGSKETARIYNNIGNSHMQLGNYAQAEEYMLKALELRKEMGDIGSLRDSYSGLSDNSKARNDYKAAYDYLVKFNQYDDSVFNEVKSKQIAEIQTLYETEKKDQAIASLEQDREIQQLKSERQANQIYLSLGGLVLFLVVAFVFYNRSRLRHKANQALALKNEEIRKQNDEKEVLLKEIHHRVKNNLQIISSLLSMQTRNMSDAKMIDVMKESQSRVKTMALIHEKLYQYDNLSRINMREYMKQLSDFLSQTYRTNKKIEVVVEAEDIHLDIDTAVPLGLIANELLSNALKYAFKDMDQGEIRIILDHRDSEGYRLIVSDTGKGISEDLALEKSGSLGLKLVRTLTRQINGHLSITPTPGATFSIEFKETPLAA